jgi:hypothetical protein
MSVSTTPRRQRSKENTPHGILSSQQVMHKDYSLPALVLSLQFYKNDLGSTLARFDFSANFLLLLITLLLEPCSLQSLYTTLDWCKQLYNE